MVSLVLLAIVLKKTNLKGVGKNQVTRMLEDFVDSFQGIFALIAAVTLQVGMMPFLLSAMVSESCASFPAQVIYNPERLLGASKMVVFFSNILLMFLGCGVLVFIHNNAWYSLLVVSACFVVAVIVILLHICSCWWWYRRADNNAGGTKGYHSTVQEQTQQKKNAKKTEEYHSKLEHALEFSADITTMMFLVLGSVVLEGLLRRTQQVEPLAPAPSEGLTIKEPGAFLSATLFFSFLTGAFAAMLMNVWTIC